MKGVRSGSASRQGRRSSGLDAVEPLGITVKSVKRDQEHGLVEKEAWLEFFRRSLSAEGAPCTKWLYGLKPFCFLSV